MIQFQDLRRNRLGDLYPRYFSGIQGIVKFSMAISLLLGAGAAEAKTVYVNAAATNSGSGSSWKQAYKYLRDALDDTSAEDLIYVAKGNYYPDDGRSGQFGDRELSFEMTGQKIYGGFAGTETSLNQRNPQNNPTILSGAIWDLPDEDGYWSLHVVVVAKSSTLDGVTVENGHASGSDSWGYPPIDSYDKGGGCYVEASKILTLSGCQFRNNRALLSGGAIMVADDGGKVIATDCIFEGNSIPSYYDLIFGIASGGAIKGNVEATRCRFEANVVKVINPIGGPSSSGFGGAIAGNVSAINCQFVGNSVLPQGFDAKASVEVLAAGGAIFGDVSASNCQFSANVSNAIGEFDHLTSSGGAISGGSVNAVNCSFSENSSGAGKIVLEDGTGTGGGGAVYVSAGKSILANCVFVNNTSKIRGGAIHSATSSFTDSLLVANCTFLDNGVANGFKGAALSCGGIVKATNNVFWYNNPIAGDFDQSGLIYVILKGVLRNSDVNYPTAATVAPNVVKNADTSKMHGYGADIFLGNFAVTILTGDPLFTNAADPDGADNLWGTADDGLRPSPGSSALGFAPDPRIKNDITILPKDIWDIDGDGNVSEDLPLDILGSVRVQNSFLEMGAYEFGSLRQEPEIAVFQLGGAELRDGSSNSFGSVVHKSSNKKTFTIKNTGTGVLRNISISMSSSTQFTVKKPTITSLNGGASTTFTVTFRPSTKGLKTARLYITSNDADESPFDIKLSGTGILRKTTKSSLSFATASDPVYFMKLSASYLPAASICTTTMVVDGSKYLLLTVQKQDTWSQVNHTVEVSSNLMDWYSGSHYTTTLVDSPTVLSVRDNVPSIPGEKRYIRLR
jgi:hypothetical protein